LSHTEENSAPPREPAAQRSGKSDARLSGEDGHRFTQAKPIL
jgi:hypothetical protein